jgi:hypothetical protein
MISSCIASMLAQENPPVATLDILNARRMLGCSSYTQPPCIAIVAGMLKSYKTGVAASESESRQIPQLYMTLWSPPTCL